ncbi:hypothetical protein ABPG72_008912 [Tetrahymena utriculariae]
MVIRNQISQAVQKRRNQLDEIHLHMRVLDDRFAQLQKQWLAASQDTNAILGLGIDLQKKQNLIHETIIRKREIELTPKQADTMLDKIMDCIDKRFIHIQEQMNEVATLAFKLRSRLQKILIQSSERQLLLF